MTKKSLCDKCTGLCCRYFALPIETPEDRDDYDDIRWYLCHEDVTVFVEDGEWYVNVKNRCRNLMKDNRCAIYERRPKICHSYSDDGCDFTSGEYDYELHFTNDQQMEEYMRIKFDNNMIEKGQAKSRKKPGKKAGKTK
ncbi:YkgJ family cysteine cluster protein [Planctomycetota bacterium]